AVAAAGPGLCRAGRGGVAGPAGDLCAGPPEGIRPHDRPGAGPALAAAVAEAAPQGPLPPPGALAAGRARRVGGSRVPSSREADRLATGIRYRLPLRGLPGPEPFPGGPDRPGAPASPGGAAP